MKDEIVPNLSNDELKYELERALDATVSFCDQYSGRDGLRQIYRSSNFPPSLMLENGSDWFRYARKVLKHSELHDLDRKAMEPLFAAMLWRFGLANHEIPEGLEQNVREDWRPRSGDVAAQLDLLPELYLEWIAQAGDHVRDVAFRPYLPREERNNQLETLRTHAVVNKLKEVWNVLSDDMRDELLGLNTDKNSDVSIYRLETNRNKFFKELVFGGSNLVSSNLRDFVAKASVALVQTKMASVNGLERIFGDLPKDFVESYFSYLYELSESPPSKLRNMYIEYNKKAQLETDERASTKPSRSTVLQEKDSENEQDTENEPDAWGTTQINVLPDEPVPLYEQDDAFQQRAQIDRPDPRFLRFLNEHEETPHGGFHYEGQRLTMPSSSEERVVERVGALQADLTEYVEAAANLANSARSTVQTNVPVQLAIDVMRESLQLDIRGARLMRRIEAEKHVRKEDLGKQVTAIRQASASRSTWRKYISRFETVARGAHSFKSLAQLVSADYGGQPSATNTRHMFDTLEHLAREQGGTVSSVLMESLGMDSKTADDLALAFQEQILEDLIKTNMQPEVHARLERSGNAQEALDKSVRPLLEEVQHTAAATGKDFSDVVADVVQPEREAPHAVTLESPPGVDQVAPPSLLSQPSFSSSPLLLDGKPSTSSHGADDITIPPTSIVINSVMVGSGPRSGLDIKTGALIGENYASASSRQMPNAANEKVANTPGAVGPVDPWITATVVSKPIEAAATHEISTRSASAKLELYLRDGKKPVAGSRFAAFSFSKKPFPAVILGLSSDKNYVWVRRSNGREKPVAIGWLNGLHAFEFGQMVSVIPSLRKVEFKSETIASRARKALNLFTSPTQARDLLSELAVTPQALIQKVRKDSFLTRSEAEALYQDIEARAKLPTEKETAVRHLPLIRNSVLLKRNFNPGDVVCVVGNRNDEPVLVLDARKYLAKGQIATLLGRSENSEFIIMLLPDNRVAALPNIDEFYPRHRPARSAKRNASLVRTEHGFEEASSRASQARHMKSTAKRVSFERA